MSIRRNVQSVGGSSFQELELAADRHYFAGLKLATHGLSGDASYLLGYTAEIILKISYFKIRDGVTSTDYLDPRLQSALNDGRIYFGWSRNERWRFHELMSWANLHCTHRRRYGYSLPRQTEASLISRMLRLQQNWTVEMRYHVFNVTDQEIANVYNHVTWLRDHFVTRARR